MGISVVSANTDGIVVKMTECQETVCQGIVADWQNDTDYTLESTDYQSLNSRDINNYIAVKEDGVKGKGAFADQSDRHYQLRSNPACQICSKAVKALLLESTPIEETIRASQDVRDFLTLRTVSGGALKDGEYIGKAIRWYYGRHELDAIFYRTNGNKVPKSEGAVPILQLPDRLPSDLDYSYYIQEAESILNDIGYNEKG